MATNGAAPSVSGRSWERRFMMMAGVRVGYHEIKCSIQTCGATKTMLDRHQKQIPADIVEKRLRKMGWNVGHNEKHDRCPDCERQATLARREKQKRKSNETSNLINLVFNKGDEPVASKPAPAAQELTRDSRRIIMMKLDEVYESAEKGYRVPWTDHGVATDLGVPAAWVSSLREEFFGPARDNSEIREVLTAIRTMGERAATIIQDAERLNSEASAVLGRVNTMNGTLVEVKRGIEALLAKADRIGKAVQA